MITSVGNWSEVLISRPFLVLARDTQPRQIRGFVPKTENSRVCCRLYGGASSLAQTSHCCKFPNTGKLSGKSCGSSLFFFTKIQWLCLFTANWASKVLFRKEKEQGAIRKLTGIQEWNTSLVLLKFRSKRFEIWCYWDFQSQNCLQLF